MKKYIMLIGLAACGPAQIQYVTRGCTLTKVDSGTIITCSDGTTTTVKDGVNGTDGKDGAQGAKGDTGATGAQGPAGTNGTNGTNGKDAVFTFIEPCGHSSSAYKEVLLGLKGGQIFSEFTKNSNAETVRNTLLPDGSYEDTDDSDCHFTVSTDHNGNRVVTWSGGGAHYTAATDTWGN